MSLLAAAAAVAFPPLWNTAMRVSGVEASAAVAVLVAGLWFIAIVRPARRRGLRYLATVLLSGLLGNQLVGLLLGSSWSWRNLLAAATLVVLALALALFVVPSGRNE